MHYVKAFFVGAGVILGCVWVILCVIVTVAWLSHQPIPFWVSIVGFVPIYALVIGFVIVLGDGILDP